MFVVLADVAATSSLACISVSPGCMTTAKQMPRKALNSDVNAKYANVRMAMRPFMRAFKLAEPEIRLDIINGKINSFNSLINNSPGYEISVIEFSLNRNERKLKPGNVFEMNHR